MPKNTFQFLLTAKLQRCKVLKPKSAQNFCALLGEIIWEPRHHQIDKNHKNPVRLQNRPQTKDFVDELQNMISPRLLGAGGWNFCLLRISDNIFIFWPFPVPIIRRCSPIIYPPGWPSCPARSSKSRKSCRDQQSISNFVDFSHSDG